MADINFHPFPVLTTVRLTLRKLAPPDAGGIFALRSNKDIVKYTGITKYTALDEAKSYIEKIEGLIERNQGIVWSITLTSSKTFVGTICYWNISRDETCAEIGYDLLPVFHGQGIMQEAIKAVIEYGFEGMELDRIVADLRTENIKSVKILEANGFLREKIYEITTGEGNPAEMAVYHLEKKDYEHRHRILPAS